MSARAPVFCGRLAATLAVLVAATVLAQESARSPASSAEAREQYRAAVALQNREVYELAAEEWSAFLKQHPRDPLAAKALHYRGICRFQLSNYGQAEADFQAVVNSRPDKELLESAYANLALAQYNRGQADGGRDERALEAALKTFATQLKQFPQGEYAPLAVYYQAEAQYVLGRIDEAIRSYRKFVSTQPQHRLRGDALYGLGVAQFEKDDVAAAGETFAAFLKEQPAHELTTEVEMRLGDALFAQERYAEAEPRFARAAQSAGFALADYAMLRRAACRFEEQDYAGAAASYAELVEAFPKSSYASTAALNAGKAWLREGKPRQAVGWLRRAWRAKGDTQIESAHWLARSLLQDKQYAEAQQIAEQALRQRPTGDLAIQLHLDRADALYWQPNRRAEAARAYAAVADDFATHPRAAWARYLAADTALGLGQHREAAGHAEAFLRSFAKHELTPKLLHALGEAKIQLKDHNAAANAFRTLLEQHDEPASRDAWRNRLALCLSLAGKHGGAIQSLQPHVDQFATEGARGEAEYLMGAAHVNLRQWPQAIAMLQRALGRESTGASEPFADRALYHLGQAQHGAGQKDDAIRTMQRLIASQARSPLLMQAQFRLAEYLSSGGQHAAAAEQFAKVVQQGGRAALVPHALLGLAAAQTQLGQLEQAKQTLARLLERFPDHATASQAFFARAVAREKNGDYEGALADLRRFLATNPQGAARSDALFVQGLAQAGLKQWPRALATFGSILQQDPEYAAADRVLYELAWAHQSKGDKQLASDAFQRMAEAYPNSPLAAEGLYRAGEFSYASQAYDSAAKLYKSAKSKASSAEIAEKADHKLAWCLFQQEQFDEARAVFAQQAEQFPQGELAGDAQLMVGECWFKLKKYEQALAALQTALQRKPSTSLHAAALLHAGQSASQLKAWRQALKFLETCASTYPESPYRDEVDYERGWAQYNSAQHEAAEKLFETLADRNNTDLGARARFMIGEIQMGSKDYADAVRTFFRVAYGYGYPNSPESFHPWQSGAMFDAARCLEQLGKRAAAVKLYREMLQNFPTSEHGEQARQRISELSQ